MTRPKKLLVALVVGLLLVEAGVSALAHMRAPVMDMTAAAPDFSWQGMDGKTHAFKELSGRAVVVHFWASWCAPCRDELPSLLAAAATMKDVVFLAVSGDQKRADAENFIRQAQILSGTQALPNVMYALDPDEALTFSTFQTAVYPESIFIDSKHQMRRKVPGPIDWRQDDVRAYLSRLNLK